MAQNVGIIKIKGLLDGKIFYRRNGKDIVQSKGGFDGARIKSEARYEKTRNLGNEFGRCAKQASVLKNLLQPFLSPISDPYIYNWIQSMLVRLKNLDTVSPSGLRNASMGLSMEGGQKILKSFQFNRNCSLGNVLISKFSIFAEEGKLCLSASKRPILFPEGAAYAAVQLILIRMDFDIPDAVIYVSECGLIHAGVSLTEDLILDADSPKGDGVLMALLSVQFLNIVGEELVFLKSEKNVLGIVGLLLPEK